MAEFEGTLNTVDDPTTASSPVADTSAVVPDDVGGTPPAAAQNADTATDPGKAADTKAADEAKAAEAKEAEAKAAAEKADEERFDKHPRFKQLLGKVKELEAKLATAPVEAKTTRDFDGELKALDEKLENGNLSLAEYQKQARVIAKEQSQAEWDARASAEQGKAEQQKLQAQFLTDHPYVEKLVSEQADAIAELKTANPLHDDISAAMALHIKELEAGRDQAIKEAVDQAVKETETRVRKDIEAKRTAKSLGAGPATPPQPTDALKDTSQAGGLKVALAQKLRTLREAS